MKYENLARTIIEKVGGVENIKHVFHCITRLRFTLVNESIAQTEDIKNLEGVVTVIQSGGQYQVVIGNHVTDVFKAILVVGNIETEQDTDEEDKKSESSGNLLNRFVDTLGGVFTPILGILAAAGMIKGFNALFIALGWLTESSGTYQLLNVAGDALFHFFPIFLGYTAMKKFGGSPFLGMALGAALVYPTLSGLTAGEPLYTLFVGTIIESPIHLTFLGIPVILMNYGSSVIPVIISCLVGAKIEKRLRKCMPDVIKNFAVPLITMLTIIPLTFIIIGPIATWVAQLLGSATVSLYEFSPILTGIILGGFWQIFVMFGLHWGIIPIAINNVMTLGFDPILAAVFAVSFAQTGAIIAVYLKTKDQKIKSLAIPAIISGFFGVTEPAIYGISLPLKKPFIMSCIAGAIGGAIIGAFGTLSYVMGGLGVFGIPSFIHPEQGLHIGFWGAIIAMLIGLILGFVLTYLFGFGDKKEN